jgi:hypothetical protein
MSAQSTEEKYFVLNNAYEFIFIIRCNRDKLSQILNYGIDINRNSNNSFNIPRLAEWLRNHRIAFRAEYCGSHNPLLKKLILNALEGANRIATKSNLFIHNDEMEVLSKNLDDDKYDVLWEMCLDKM